MKYCHKLLENIAKEICGAAYEDMAKDDIFFKHWPNQKMFIKKQWGNFVKPARESLAQLLGRPDWPEEQKELMMEALFYDRALPPNGDTAVQVPIQRAH